MADKDFGALALDLLDLSSGDGEITSADLAPTALPVGNDANADILNRISPAAGPAAEAAAAPLAAAESQKDCFAGILSRRAETPDYLDRMSDAQKALLPSSLNLSPDETKQLNPVEAPVAKVAATIVAPEKVAEKIDSVTAVEKPAARAAAVHKASFSGNRTDWQELSVPPGIDPNSPEWVAKTMMQALDKYESSFGASGSRGKKLNSDILASDVYDHQTEPSADAPLHDLTVDQSGVLSWHGASYPCALGKHGIVRGKSEGDGATPVGAFPVRRVLYRPDRLAPPRSGLPVAPLTPRDGWCNDPAHPLYNHQVRHPVPASCELRAFMAHGFALRRDRRPWL